MYVCMYVCMYMYLYVYMYTYVYVCESGHLLPLTLCVCSTSRGDEDADVHAEPANKPKETQKGVLKVPCSYE